MSDEEGFAKVMAGEPVDCFFITGTLSNGSPFHSRRFDREHQELATHRMNLMGAFVDLHRQRINPETMLWESVEMLVIAKVSTS